jgi:hypothetical protein
MLGVFWYVLLETLEFLDSTNFLFCLDGNINVSALKQNEICSVALCNVSFVFTHWHSCWLPSCNKKAYFLDQHKWSWVNFKLVSLVNAFKRETRENIDIDKGLQTFGNRVVFPFFSLQIQLKTTEDVFLSFSLGGKVSSQGSRSFLRLWHGSFWNISCKET